MILYSKKKLVIPLGINPNYNQDDKDPLQDKTADSSTQFQSIYPDAGYSGMSRIDINPYVLDSSSAILTANGDYAFTSDKDGLSRVDVKVDFDTAPVYNEGYNQGKSEQKALLTEISITENGTYTREDGYSKVNVDVRTVNNQEKSVKSSTSLQEVVPDADYSGLSKVIVEPYTVESLTVEPKITEQVISPMSADAISDVTVNAVTSAIDSNIVAGNIKKDVSILGVTGTFEGVEPEPSATPVSYISNENDGTLVFDTGYVPKENTKIIAKVAFGGKNPSNPNNGRNFWGVQSQFVFTEWGGYPSNNIGIQINNTPKTLPDLLADGTNGNLEEFLDVQMENYKLTIGDRFVVSPAESFTVTHSMFLFGSSSIDTGNLAERSSRLIRISSFSIFEGNDLIKSLIPFKDLNGKGCLYDTSTETFIYPLQGTPTLGKEISYQEKRVSASLTDVVVKPDPGFKALSEVIVNGVTASVDPNIVSENIKNGVEILGVAGTYTGSIFYRCGYVSNNSSNKSVYRDTGIVPKQNTRVEAVISFEDINSGAGGYGYFFGTTGGPGYVVFDCRELGGYGNKNVSCILDRDKGKIPRLVMSSAPMKICMGQIEGEYSFMSVNGYIFKDAVKNLTFSSANTIYIWAANSNGRVDEYSSRVMRVYDFKIFEGDALVFHGVPVIDNEGAATFIDLVTNTVVPGEGNLTGGGVYVEPDEESYIENGTYDGNLSDVYFNLGSGSNFYNTSSDSDINEMAQYSEIIASVPDTKSDANSPCLYGVSDPANNSGYMLSLNGTEVNVCAGTTNGTTYGTKEIPKGANNLTINSFKANSNTYNTAFTGCSANTIAVELRSNDDNYITPLTADVHLFSANYVGNEASTMYRCLRGTKIYQFKYFNLTDKEVHILVPDYYNGKYCFKDALTGDRIYAKSGTPTGNISKNYKPNNGAILIEE